MVFKHLFTAGGLVMWPLLLFSIVAIALIIERSVFWLRVNRRQPKVVREVLHHYRLNNMVAVLDKLQKNVDLPAPRVFLAALQLEHPTPEEFRLALETEAQAELPLLKRFTNIFEVIVTMSPLLGLFGTVLGLITSFASLNIGDVGGSQTTNVTAGISEALIATASGLAVALLTLPFASSFRAIYHYQVGLIQEYAGQLELLHRHRYERSEMSSVISR